MKQLPKILISILAIIGVIFIVILLLPESYFEETKKDETSSTEATESTEKLTPTTLKNSVPIKYKKTTNFQAIEKRYREKKLLENIFTSLSEFIKLPSDLTAEYGECEEENAFYDPETKKITVCYEIIDWIEKLNKDEEEKEEITKNILTFFILHEIGHALIHLYELPTTGREEDVADQLATFFLLGTNDIGALDAADSFYNDL